ncbi:MAG TPA: chemotaxis protein CheW [Kofleriaceae bacterium]|nr:chemotaxis protein CheW [Kofleriaceae bacterium]
MTARAGELRDEFDRAFAAGIKPRDAGHGDVLLVELGGEPYALRLGDIASLHAALRIVALPTRAPELLGVAAIRATVVPIYDLATALGMPRAAATPWIAVHHGGAAGFAFEGYEGHARIPQRSIAATAQRGHVVGQLVVGGRPRSVVDLGSVLTALEARWNQSGIAKEQ